MEYERVLREKKKTYAEYRQARQDMKDIQTAKYNIDHFLRQTEEEQRAASRAGNIQGKPIRIIDEVPRYFYFTVLISASTSVDA